MIPYDERAYQLLHDGVVALAEVEKNGIRIDERYLRKAVRSINRRIQGLKKNLLKSSVGKVWKKKFKDSTNTQSGQQLAEILFNEMGFPVMDVTPTGQPKTDEGSLSKIDHPFVKDFLEIKKYQKLVSTYLKGVQSEVVDGFLHPVFNLHIPVSFRSSSSDPNFQNMPIRDPKIARWIRRAFIPRIGRVLVEIDYGGVEVRIAACYHKDPNMIEEIINPERDMHRDLAMKCFKLSAKEMPKDKKEFKRIRYCGKNMFVFPQFYGDWYLTCAKNLWDAIDSMDLRTEEGLSLKRHLKRKGVNRRGTCEPGERSKKGTFEHHIKQVERWFWEQMFPVYTEWKNEWWESYSEKGWFKTKTGFICQGVMSRNEAINYPVQGSAFHCLLWSMIRIQRAFKRKKLKSLVVGQIHDSVILDVPEEELHSVVELCQEIMVDKLQKHWKWIIVPLEVEAEVTPVDGNWYEKKEYSLDN